MFGFVTANLQELTKEQRQRYNAVYCGICRQMRQQASHLSRFALSYDMTFLALLLMSLYEPEEQTGPHACAIHLGRPWVDNEYVRYAADMNLALAYHKARDDEQDEGSRKGKFLDGVLGKHYPRVARDYPRQCGAMERCIAQLNQLERDNAPSPDEAANCFGALMAELLVYREDHWSDTLRQMGMALGRFIYLADGAADYRRDLRKHLYNPFIAMGTGEDWPRWEGYLVLAMGTCTQEFEKLPLVQDKPLLDNILYSGVWCNLGKRRKGENP